MKKIGKKELKHLQLDILNYVDLFCKENNIQYSLAFGTLLGAIRHQGMIPWDDDIDICMLRPDYDRFVREFEDPSGIYECLAFEKDKNFIWPFAKVSDCRTLVVEQGRYVDKFRGLGVNIDVFPVDATHATDLSQLKRQRRLSLIRSYKMRYLSRNRSLMKNLALLTLRGVLSVIPIKTIVGKMIANAKKIKYEDSCYVEMILGYEYEKPLPKEVFEKTNLKQFEDAEYPVPIHYHTLLEHLYGDYMKPPPENQRIGHHMADRYYKPDI